MPFTVIRNDIARVRADAIVCAADPNPVVGGGVDAAIHQKAGPALLEARKQLGVLRPGTAAVTPAFGLDARIVIHTVGPVWRGGLLGEARILRSCYDKALNLALEAKCRSVAFPLIGTGNYGFPKEKALQIAQDAFRDFLSRHRMQILLVVFDEEAHLESQKLFGAVAAYIDRHYADQTQMRQVREYGLRERPSPRCDVSAGEFMPAPMARPCAATAPVQKKSLRQMLEGVDAGFSETLLRYIDKTGKKDSEIYKKANLSKQHFSKIRNNPDYKPTKATALALAIALELDLEKTKDLIGRAGFAFSNSSKFDLIVRYFIEQGIYDIMQINMTLYEFDQSLLGM